MALIRRLFYRKPPDRLLEISEGVYVFDCCFSSVVMEEDEYKDYIGSIMTQLEDYFPDASFLVFNIRGGEKSHTSDILSQHHMKVMDCPRQYEGCPLLPLAMLHHFLKSCESWLSVEGKQNVLLIHCEGGGWPVLAFILAGLLLYRKQYTGEQRTLEMVYKQAPMELLYLSSPVNPQASHLRYLQYISKRGSGSEWPPQDIPFTLDCLILRDVPNFDGEGGCRLIIRVYGLDPSMPSDKSSKVLSSSSKSKKQVRHYSQVDSAPIKINVRCCVQGDVVLECIHMEKDLEHEEMMFRVMFNTAFINSHILLLNHEDIDVVWKPKIQFSKDFKAEVIFSDLDAESDTATEVAAVDEDEMEVASTEEFFEAEEIFSNPEWHDGQRSPDFHTVLAATSLLDRSPKLEISSPYAEAKSSFEFWNSEDVKHDATYIDETVAMLGNQAEGLLTNDVKHDEIFVTKRIAIFDNIFVDSEGSTLEDQEKGTLETSNFENDTQIIANREVEERVTSGTNNIKQDTKGIGETITSDNKSHKSETQILSAEANYKLEENVPKQIIQTVSIEKKSVLEGRSSDIKTPNIADEIRRNLETTDGQREKENVVTEIKLEPKILSQKSEVDIQTKKSEELLPSTPKKLPACIMTPTFDSVLSDPKIEHQESLINHTKLTIPETISFWNPTSKGCDATFMHVPSHSPLEYNSSPSVLAISAISHDNVPCETVDISPISSPTGRIITSTSQSKLPTSPPILSSMVSIATFTMRPPSISSTKQEFSAPDQFEAPSLCSSPPIVSFATSLNAFSTLASSLPLPSPTPSPPPPSSKIIATTRALPPPPPPPPLPSFRTSLYDYFLHPCTSPLPPQIGETLKASFLSPASLCSSTDVPITSLVSSPPQLPLPSTSPPPFHVVSYPPSSMPLHSTTFTKGPPPPPFTPPFQGASIKCPPPPPPPMLSGSWTKIFPPPHPCLLTRPSINLGASPNPPPLSPPPPPPPAPPPSSLICGKSTTHSPYPPPPIPHQGGIHCDSLPPPPPPPPPPPLPHQGGMPQGPSPSPPPLRYEGGKPRDPPSLLPSLYRKNIGGSIPPPLPPPSPLKVGSFVDGPLNPPPPPPPPPMTSSRFSSTGSLTTPPLTLQTPLPSSNTLNVPKVAAPTPPPLPYMHGGAPLSPCSTGACREVPPPPPPPPRASGGVPLLRSGHGGIPLPPPPYLPSGYGGLPPQPLVPGGHGGAPPPPPPLGVRGVPPPPPSPSARGGAPPPPPLPGACRGTPPPPPPPGGHGRGPPPPPPAGLCAPPALSRSPGAPPPPPAGLAISQAGTRGVATNCVLGGRGNGLTRATTPRKSSLKPLHWVKVTRAVQGSLWADLQKYADTHCTSEFDVSELESLFSAVVQKDNKSKAEGRNKSITKSDKVHLIDLRRANNTEIMLTKIKMPLSDMMNAALALDDSILDADQVENLIKFCPTKEEMELLKGYTGNRENLGKCEQFFLELMKVPRVESKLRVFSFKILFGSQISDFNKCLNIVGAACDEIRNSDKLKEIMKKILYLGNTLNQGTARGSAIGFRLDSLLKLTDTRAANNKMTLMHYLCKVLASKSPHLLDFYTDLVSLEAASKIQLKSLSEEMQAIAKGLEKVELELTASERDGPVSEFFCNTLKEFTAVSGAKVQSLTSLHTAVGKNADALIVYFGEDPVRCPFEQVITTLVNFVRLFRRAHEENCKQAELEKKKATQTEKSKDTNPIAKNAR